ncbi:sulfatase-like hydrolase/transferase [Rhizobium sp. L1K21]|uniref:sulfatase-like hydrolase/transferase n=1 Tax=Rhizobium sp. L1K21 TaxID=2954933 RepID=UPI0020937116|nr:sulfatase-like hydrolase/transferase [Rhizobium sp. L1K21]MCO6187713.1 sulfatase [Rhizobium sp. L1K21]
MAKNANIGKGSASPAWLAILAVIFVTLISFASLTLPDHPNAFSVRAFFRFPVEIPVILLVLLLLPRRLAAAFAILSTLALFTLLFLKGADIGVQSAFQRRFNPYLDMKMLADAWNLLSGAIGQWSAGLAIALGAAAFLALGVLFFAAQRKIASFRGTVWWGSLMAAFVLLAAGAVLWVAAPALPVRAELRGLPYLADRLALVQKSVADMRQFERDLQNTDPVAQTTNLFAGIKGRDVILVFVESYGRSAVEDPRYSPIMKPRLQSVEDQLQAAGFGAVSAWSLSPTMGGLSWLAHGTFLSGLWTDSQARFDRLMISRRESLNRLFKKAGWRTTAVMPAITMDWPEAAYFGYDQVLAAKDLDYKGKPFNWVTMPDQYTLSAFERLARKPAQAQGQPVMAEIALISSHAPWTPVAKLIDWNDVGDGAVFNAQAESGLSPREVWSDGDSIREHYIQTIDYSLQTLGDYIAHYGDDAVFIILGDHQPAPIVTGPDASRAVPIHIISRDKSLLARFLEHDFTVGMTPAVESEEIPMSEMRERLVQVLSAAEPSVQMSSADAAVAESDEHGGK